MHRDDRGPTFTCIPNRRQGQTFPVRNPRVGAGRPAGIFPFRHGNRNLVPRQGVVSFLPKIAIVGQAIAVLLGQR